MSREFVTKREFETWKQNFEKRKGATTILSELVIRQGVGLVTPQIVYGTFNAGSSAITFTRAFKTGTTPSVCAITASVYCFCTITNLSNTRVTIRSMSAETLAQTSQNVYWIAIGEAS